MILGVVSGTKSNQSSRQMKHGTVVYEWSPVGALFAALTIMSPSGRLSAMNDKRDRV